MEQIHENASHLIPSLLPTELFVWGPVGAMEFLGNPGYLTLKKKNDPKYQQVLKAETYCFFHQRKEIFLRK